jgi:hypothetical protein
MLSESPLLVLALSLLVLAAAGSASAAQDRELAGFGPDFDLSAVVTHDTQVSLAPGPTLRISTGHTEPWPGIVLKAPAGHWDLSDCAWASVQVRNTGSAPASVGFRVDNPGANGREHCVQVVRSLQPGQNETVTAALAANGTRFSTPVKLEGMRGVPGGSPSLDPANVTQVLVFVDHPDSDGVLEVSSVRAGGSVRTIDAATFFPFIDRFGQYIHSDWPGKTHSEADLKAAAQQEAADLKQHPGPTDWDRWGGWAAGPKLEATGFFRTQKLDGRWWLVDPDGRPFWSNGIDCVGPNSAVTPVTGRENYFADLPAPDSPFARFYGRSSWAPHGFYAGKGGYQTYGFSRANLLRKYGPDYEAAFQALCHQRLRSWGLNTIGNWSDGAIYLQDKTPYVLEVWHGGRQIEGSEGYWGKFPDPFDPEFRTSLARNMEQQGGKSAGDPYCIGYFTDNELGWGDDVSLAVAALRSPAGQPAKQAFVADLKAKYATIEALNRAWGTSHASWDALLQDRSAPPADRADADLRAFYAKLAETYFRTCREEIKRAAPNNLYLGCRFGGGWRNDATVRAAAKYCDVVSLNLYQYSLAGFRLPEGVDAPVLVGEFHFGALDRGLFHPGLCATDNQQDRAAKYTAYVRSALANPCIVGAHWFQFGDEATTGRGDGENYQIGFVDVCGTPYTETIAASRQVGYRLYEERSETRDGD